MLLLLLMMPRRELLTSLRVSGEDPAPARTSVLTMWPPVVARGSAGLAGGCG